MAINTDSARGGGGILGALGKLALGAVTGGAAVPLLGAGESPFSRALGAAKGVSEGISSVFPKAAVVPQDMQQNALAASNAVLGSQYGKSGAMLSAMKRKLY